MLQHIIIIITIIINFKWVCTRWQQYYNTQKIAHTHTQNNTQHTKKHKITNIMFQSNKEFKVDLQHNNTENTKHTKKKWYNSDKSYLNLSEDYQKRFRPTGIQQPHKW